MIRMDIVMRDDLTDALSALTNGRKVPCHLEYIYTRQGRSNSSGRSGPRMSRLRAPLITTLPLRTGNASMTTQKLDVKHALDLARGRGTRMRSGKHKTVFL